MENEERWKELCAQASVEQDPHRLSELVAEIVRLLDLRQGQMRRRAAEEPEPAENP